MTPEEAYKMYCSSMVDKDDFIQECWLAVLEHQNEKPEELFKVVGTRMRKQVTADVLVKAPHIYNDDGECVDDDVYFVDQSTVEKYGEGKRLDDNIIEQGKLLAKTIQTVAKMTDILYFFNKNIKSDSARINCYLKNKRLYNQYCRNNTHNKTRRYMHEKSRRIK